MVYFPVIVLRSQHFAKNRVKIPFLEGPMVVYILVYILYNIHILSYIYLTIKYIISSLLLIIIITVVSFQSNTSLRLWKHFLNTTPSARWCFLKKKWQFSDGGPGHHSKQRQRRTQWNLATVVEVPFGVPTLLLWGVDSSCPCSC